MGHRSSHHHHHHHHRNHTQSDYPEYEPQGRYYPSDHIPPGATENYEATLRHLRHPSIQRWNIQKEKQGRDGYLNVLREQNTTDEWQRYLQDQLDDLLRRSQQGISPDEWDAQVIRNRGLLKVIYRQFHEMRNLCAPLEGPWRVGPEAVYEKLKMQMDELVSRGGLLTTYS